MVAGALNVDPAKYQSKGRKSVRSRIGNIRSFLKKDMTLQDFWAYLTQALSSASVQRDSLTEEELWQVQKLKEEKYDTWEWTYGKSPRYNVTCKQRWPGGNLEIYAEVAQGLTQAITIYGDFMATRSMQEITNALTGCQFRPEVFAERLKQFHLPDYFGGVTEEEFLQTVFGSAT